MQQINLYQSHLKKQEPVVSFNQLSISTLILVFLLASVYSYNIYKLNTAQTTLKNLNVQLAQKSQALALIKNSRPQIKKNVSLKDKLVTLENDIVSKQIVLDVLSGKKLGNTTGFANYFEGLARQVTNGVWLTKLHFLDGGTVMDLQGKTQQPELVAKYLKALATEQVFNGTEFNSFIIQRNEKDKPLLFKFNNYLKSTAKSVELSRR